jgi:hypothetical protein
MEEKIFKAACDGCPRSFVTTGPNKEDVRDILPKAGWRVNGDKLYCPRCAEKR